MQSTNEGKRNFRAKENASTATRPDGIGETRKAAMEAWVGSGVFVLLFVASVAYVGFGGTLALEASPIPEPETSAAAVTAELADAGGGPAHALNTYGAGRPCAPTQGLV